MGVFSLPCFLEKGMFLSSAEQNPVFPDGNHIHRKESIISHAGFFGRSPIAKRIRIFNLAAGVDSGGYIPEPELPPLSVKGDKASV